MSALEIRIEKASEIISIKDLPKDQLKKIVKQTLDHIGIDDSLIGVQVLEAKTTTFDDFYKVFETSELVINGIITKIEGMIPVPRLKLAWDTLKEIQEEKNELTGSGILNLKPIGQWQDIELLEQYGKDCPDAIQEELAKRAKGRYTIIFNDDETVDSENSLYMLRKARYQETPSTFIVRNEVKEVYRVGEFQMGAFFECPVHQNVLLVDGYCDECGRKWQTDDWKKNSFIRLLVESGEVADIRNYRNYSFDELRKEFPKLYIKFRGLDEEGKLPSLKRKLSKSKQGDPFRVVGSSHRNY